MLPTFLGLSNSRPILMTLTKQQSPHIPEILVQTLQEIAINRCGVPPVEVLPERLRNVTEDQQDGLNSNND
jgi:hypothetical protein